MAANVSMCVRQVVKFSRLSYSLLLHNPSRCCRVRMSTTVTNGKPSEAETKSGDAEQKVDSPEPSVVEKQLTEEKEKLQSQLEDFKDKYLRSLAETENVRQRMTKQIDDAKSFGIQGFCKDLLEVADILGKATESVPKDQISSNPHLKGLFEGLLMTESQLQKVFIKHGLHQIVPSEGDKFDPFLHEALFEVPTTDKEGGSIAMLQKTGYRLQNRTIRPALVGVFKTS